MCARWHIKGDCFDTCPCTLSHVPGSKITPKQKEAFLGFMKKCRESPPVIEANKRDNLGRKRDRLLGLEPSSVRPPGKPPDSSTPLPFEFKYKPLCARTTLSVPPISSSNLSLPPQTSVRVTNEPAGPSPWLHPSSSATRETAKQKACCEAMLAETTKQVNNLIGEFVNLPSSPSQEPKREPANIQLPTKHVNEHFERHNHPRANCAS